MKQTVQYIGTSTLIVVCSTCALRLSNNWRKIVLVNAAVFVNDPEF